MIQTPTLRAAMESWIATLPPTMAGAFSVGADGGLQMVVQTQERNNRPRPGSVQRRGSSSDGDRPSWQRSPEYWQPVAAARRSMPHSIAFAVSDVDRPRQHGGGPGHQNGRTEAAKTAVRPIVTPRPFGRRTRRLT